ncbi:hypothetical protein DPMN_033922 [Dreissena polymorpha]|uniref:Reelin domain-containing protein n=2 Tax=Dreissena polymorpha TaxID=45954 RepID=A0A9D4M6L9_DREPO|nr:hypothetical protein DPMN_033922 [Dreissena polymorpha]
MVFTLLTSVLGYSSLPPSESCSSMLLVHGFSAQTAANPYQLTLSKNTYSPCGQIQVTLQGKAAGTQFQGFMIQARSAADSSAYKTYVSFATATGVGNPCNPEVSATHANTGSADKSSLSLTWTAPNSDVGNIVFVYTMVQDFLTYWVKQESAPLTYVAESGTTCTTAATTTTRNTNGTITRPSDFGKVISCFHDGCKGANCDFMLTWKETGDEILFSLACKRPQNA